MRSFFVNFRRRYNLDEVLGEYEAEHGKSEWSNSEAKDEEDNVREAEVKVSRTATGSELDCVNILGIVFLRSVFDDLLTSSYNKLSF